MPQARNLAARRTEPARLDTLLLDAERMRAEITWRAALPLYKHGIARIDAGMRAMLPRAA